MAIELKFGTYIQNRFTLKTVGKFNVILNRLSIIHVYLENLSDLSQESKELWIITFQKSPDNPGCLCQVSLIISWNHHIFAGKVIQVLSLEAFAHSLRVSTNEYWFTSFCPYQMIITSMRYLISVLWSPCLKATHWGMGWFLFHGKSLCQSHFYCRSLSLQVPIPCIVV